MSDEQQDGKMGQVIQIDEVRIRDHRGEMARGTVEEALNAMLDAEANRLCGAARYERSESCQDTRAGSYDRSLHTKAGEVTLKVPKLRRQTFETAIIERYRRRESSSGLHYSFWAKPLDLQEGRHGTEQTQQDRVAVRFRLPRRFPVVERCRPGRLHRADTGQHDLPQLQRRVRHVPDVRRHYHL